MKTSADTEVNWLPGWDAVEALQGAGTFDNVSKYVLPGADEFCVRPVLRPGPKLLDVILPRISLDNRLALPARRAFAVVALLVCVCLFNSQAQTARDSDVAVLLSGNTQAEARYRLAAGPLVLTTVPVAGGQIAFNVSSEPDARYTLEQSPRLADPVWTPVEVRVGDGATIQFRRPLDAGPTTFFRVRQEP